MGATFSDQRLTKDAPPQQGCTTPAAAPANPTFSPVDGTIYLWFNAAVAGNEHITNEWIQPNGR